MNVVLKGKDDSVAIMTLVEGADPEEAVRKFKEAHPGKYVEHFIVDKVETPDYKYRDSWILNKNNKIVVKKK